MKKIINYYETVKIGKSSKRIESKLNKAVKEITKNIENLNYNIAIIEIRQFFESLEPEVGKDVLEKFLKLLHPICPHVTEELWEKLGNKPFLTLQKWPEYDESKIDEKAEAAEEISQETISDIRKVLELAKISAPKKITLIVSETWKYRFMELFKKKIEETREFKPIIEAMLKESTLKPHAQEIQKIIPSLLKNPSKIPSVVLDQKTEKDNFDKIKENIKKEFDAGVEILIAEESKDPKAKNAMPGKPAIVVQG